MCKLSVWSRLWFSPRPCRRALSLMPWLDTSKTLWICKACSPLPCNSYVGSCCATKSWQLRCTNALMLVWVKKIVMRNNWIYHLAHKIIKMYSIYQLEAQKPIIMELENPDTRCYSNSVGQRYEKPTGQLLIIFQSMIFPCFPQRLEMWTGFLGGYPPSN